MRKITSLLMLCCLTIMTAWAQTMPTTSPAPVDGNWDANSVFYTIKNGNGKYLDGDVVSSDGKATNFLVLSSSTVSSKNAYWAVVGNDTDGYSFYNYGTGQVLTMTTDDDDTEANSYAFLKDESDVASGEETKFAFVASKKSGYWSIKVNGSERSYWTQHGALNNRLAYWFSQDAVNGWNNSGSGDDGSGFVFEEVDVDIPLPEVKTPIASLSELSNTKAYTATLPSHSTGATGWAVNTTNLKSIVYDLGLTQDNSDLNQQFAFLTPDEGATYYLYSVGQSKYIDNTGALTEEPTHPITFKAGNSTGTFVVWFDQSHIVNVGGDGQMIIDGWGPDGQFGEADNGNSIVITPVADFDPTEALKAFEEPIVSEGEFYTLECLSGNAHSDKRYICDNGSVINGNSTSPSTFSFETAGGGKFYMKSSISGKYINHSDANGIYASADKVTAWTISVPSHTPSAVTLTFGDDKYLNNNGTDCTDGSTTNLKANYHSGGPNSDNACSLWTLKVAVSETAMGTALTLAEQALAATGVGYPTADCAERAPLTAAVANANTDKTSKEYYDALAAALTAFANTSTINLPEDGKAYTFTNVHPNATYGQRYLYYNEAGTLSVASRGTATAEELPVSAKFICKEMGDGRFVFVNNNGKYLIWRGKDAGENNHTGGVDAYNSDYCPLTFVKMQLSGSNTSAASSIEDLFGLVAFGGMRDITQNQKSYFLTSDNNDPIFNQDSNWTLRYSSQHSTAFKVEEVSYPNKPVMKAANGITNGEEAIAAVATYCAPFATVLPAGVNAYYATSDQGHYVKLTLLDGAIPANTGVLLTATDDALVDQTVVMVPTADEVQGTADGNLFAADAAKGDYTVGAEVNAYVVGKSGETVGFYPLSASNRTIAQSKAYLVLDQALSAVKFYFGGDDVTGIEAVEKAESNNAPIFDLSGRRVVKAAKGGIYIQNGKKFIVK